MSTPTFSGRARDIAKDHQAKAMVGGRTPKIRMEMSYDVTSVTVMNTCRTDAHSTTKEGHPAVVVA